MSVSKEKRPHYKTQNITGRVQAWCVSTSATACLASCLTSPRPLAETPWTNRPNSELSLSHIYIYMYLYFALAAFRGWFAAELEECRRERPAGRKGWAKGECQKSTTYIYIRITIELFKLVCCICHMYMYICGYLLANILTAEHSLGLRDSC